MARKVRLDIPEAEKGEQSTGEPEPSLLPAVPSEDQQLSKGWPYNKWIVICIVVVGCCLTAVGAFFLWTMTGQKDSASERSNSHPAAVVSTAPRTMATFDNFVIDYRLQGGTVRIVTFAFTVEFASPVHGDAIQDQADLREAIYTLSKKQTEASLFAPEERGGFKKEIAAELEKRLGAGMVKGVYFTKFCIL